jgi:acyl-CoA thioesterase FadM
MKTLLLARSVFLCHKPRNYNKLTNITTRLEKIDNKRIFFKYKVLDAPKVEKSVKTLLGTDSYVLIERPSFVNE